MNWHEVWLVARKSKSLLRLAIRRVLFTPILSAYRRFLLARVIRYTDPNSGRTVDIRIRHHDAHFLVIDKPHDINIDDNKGRPGSLPTVESILQSAYPHYYLRYIPWG
jgi:hypothetical protein